MGRAADYVPVGEARGTQLRRVEARPIGEALQPEIAPSRAGWLQEDWSWVFRPAALAERLLPRSIWGSELSCRQRRHLVEASLRTTGTEPLGTFEGLLPGQTVADGRG